MAADTMVDANSLLTINGLTFSYGERDILAGVTLALQPGEMIAITGPSGSGKSTLLTLAGLLRRPPPGTIRHWGLDMGTSSNAELSARRRRVRFMFQRPYLLRSLTVLENIMTGALLSDEADAQLEQRARALLGLLGIADLASRWPEQISGGQQQRVALARAIIGKPDLLLADEPTAALDFQSAVIVIKEMQRLAAQEGCGIILTTHDLRITASATQRYNLSDGVLIRTDSGHKPAPMARS